MSAPPELPAGFLELPGRLYAGDPRWIPESPSAVRRAFSADNPWFEQGAARAWAIGGEARVAAFRDPACRVDGRPAAFFGYWESAGGGGDAALFAEVRRWARRRGAEVLCGPVDFNTYGAYRLLLAGGEELPFPGEPYNPPSYPGRLEALGLCLYRRYLTQIVDAAGAERALELLRPRRRAVIAAGYRFARLDARWWMANLELLHPLIDRIFADNPAYTPLRSDAFARVAGRPLVDKACPETSVAAYAPDGTLAGFLLAVPHYGPLVVAGAGDLRVEAGELRYRQHLPFLVRRGAVDVLLRTAGVAPAHRGKGLMSAMAAEAYRRSGGCWNRWWNVLMRQDNPSRRPGEAVAAGRRWYGLYRLEL